MSELAYREVFVCWTAGIGDMDALFDDDHPTDLPCDWGWICNQDGCLRCVDVEPCPRHAPASAPGLRLVECLAEPRHWLFAHDRDDMGHGCPQCDYLRVKAELVRLREAAERRAHRWCWLLNPLKRTAIRLRLARIWSVGGVSGPCWHVSITWRWSEYPAGGVR